MNGIEQSVATRERLVQHYHAYPRLELQDLFKFLYQSAFGCEHLISSVEAAVSGIQNERDTLVSATETPVEQLDGAYSRVPLSCALSAQTLGKLLALSAKHEENGAAALTQKLAVARELITDGTFPFVVADFDSAVAAWEKTGFSALHHSASFRNAYHPSYRVIANAYIPFFPLFAELDKRLENGTVTVAIEGGSASGKTTLAGILSRLYGCTVLHMDDFFLQPAQRTAERLSEVGGNVDRERFLAEVLQPLSRREPITYRPFDCHTQRIGEAVTVTPAQLTVVEGAYSMHPTLAPYYDFSVFLDVPPAVQKTRIVKRNSPEMAQRFFNEWIPLETAYFTQTDIQHRCDRVICVSQ